MSGEESPTREALLWERRGNAIGCFTCERGCVLQDGQLGWCGTRVNREDVLYTVIYGLVSSLSANPMEKKPFYHFHPGTLALTAGAYSCNFGCPWCQNWHISKASPPEHGEYMSPERFVELAVSRRCAGTSISFNEPTLSLEWSLDVFHVARERGLYNTYVTNGYMTAEALRLLADAGLDAMNVDVKGDAEAVRRYCRGIDVDKVWRNGRLARELGIHVEITTLIVPGVNDGDEMLRGIAARIVADLGPDVPWHVTGYYPAYRFTAPPTPMRTLARAWRIGRDAGLAFVYVGNVPGHRYGDTHCSGCEALLIERRGYRVLRKAIGGGRCLRCGLGIAGVWE